MESNNFDKKKFTITIIFAFSFMIMIVGFILVIMFADMFAGEEGYIRDNVPIEWLFIALIPFAIGGMILMISVLKKKKGVESYNKFDNASEISPEQSIRDPKKCLKIINIAQLILIILTVIFFGVLILLVILGKLSWTELIDAIF